MRGTNLWVKERFRKCHGCTLIFIHDEYQRFVILVIATSHSISLDKATWFLCKQIFHYYYCAMLGILNIYNSKQVCMIVFRRAWGLLALRDARIDNNSADGISILRCASCYLQSQYFDQYHSKLTLEPCSSLGIRTHIFAIKWVSDGMKATPFTSAAPSYEYSISMIFFLSRSSHFFFATNTPYHLHIE